jgi:hypothetical protein
MAFKSTSKLVLGILASTIIGLALVPSVSAQALSPMRGTVKSFSDQFAVRVFPANPYTHRIRIEVKVYDQDFRPVTNARVSPSQFTLGGNTSRPVNVMIPFDGQSERKVRVCAEAIPFPGKTSNIKAQICGKFLGQQAGQ